VTVPARLFPSPTAIISLDPIWAPCQSGPSSTPPPVHQQALLARRFTPEAWIASSCSFLLSLSLRRFPPQEMNPRRRSSAPIRCAFQLER